MYETLGFFAAAQQAALPQGMIMSSDYQAVNTRPTISNKDYKDQKIKYPKFKECENPIKQSELTYRG